MFEDRHAHRIDGHSVAGGQENISKGTRAGGRTAVDEGLDTVEQDDIG